jgi:hypothetical protein
MNHGVFIIEVWRTDKRALEHMYKTIPAGQEHKKGYHKIKNTWQTLLTLVIRVP